MGKKKVLKKSVICFKKAFLGREQFAFSNCFGVDITVLMFEDSFIYVLMFNEVFGGYLYEILHTVDVSGSIYEESVVEIR